MIVRHLERLVDAFLDRDRRHDDDELGKSVALVQLEDRAQIDVGLAGSRLHLHGEVAGIQRLGRGQSVAKLDLGQICENLVVEQRQPVADAEIVLREGQPLLRVQSIPGNRELRAADLLATEQVADSVHRLQLEVEVGLETELQHGRIEFRLRSWRLPSGKHQAFVLRLRNRPSQLPRSFDPRAASRH